MTLLWLALCQMVHQSFDTTQAFCLGSILKHACFGMRMNVATMRVDTTLALSILSLPSKMLTASEFNLWWIIA